MIRTAVFLVLATVVLAEDLATVKITGSDNKVSGLVTFKKSGKGIEIEGQIEGLIQGKHGFHIHQLGDLSNGCASTKGHFNPHKKPHGAPDSNIRHVGDLGNIVADENGVAKISMFDNVISLDGDNNIIGRAVVVHSGEDDLGQGEGNDTLTTGNAGGRVGCGVIGRATEGSSVLIQPLMPAILISFIVAMVTSTVL
ncbi:PREDICTED: superoxide dismutase [Cu-Zn]-like [Nicrophorus vespilloides]|uniref:Superoxide dismutase [Cu-Zn] n=1 Tax=Nicrophorus vespilloides TaxID=110193 RepID=A0ABM1MDL8_NICVS|nr:PREDICTED: superoxide dismutase [Cu-Zn]-like [Nicrophorus vespilloides]